jgi:protein-disulfide isomerase
MSEAQGVGIGGTPAFVIGSQLASGAMPFVNFQQIIDAEL